MNQTSLERLKQIAHESLEKNLQTTARGTYLAAGPRQFGSLWTRDFCYAAGGLLEIGKQNAVRDHVIRLIETRRKSDSLIPRILDSVPSRNRILLKTIGRHLGEFENYVKLKEPLKPEHLGEHGTASIDSNLLLLLTAFKVADHYPNFIEQYKGELIAIYEFYQTRKRGQLIWQGAFEDWQDSARREGFTFYVNLLHYFVLARATKYIPEIAIKQNAEALRAELMKVFFLNDQGVFRSHSETEHVSLDGNLLALAEGFYEPKSAAANSLYLKLKSHPVWTSGVGVSTVPDYPDSWISWTCRAVGLKHYHDRLQWSWLIGLSARVASVMDDLPEASRILETLGRAVFRDGMIVEVYSSEKTELQLFETFFYKSEGPFSWGAGQCLQAINEYGAKQTQI